MKQNFESQTFEQITSPNLSLPSDFNIIKEERNNSEHYYREISLSHVIIEISILVPDSLRPSVSFLFSVFQTNYLNGVMFREGCYINLAESPCHVASPLFRPGQRLQFGLEAKQGNGFDQPEYFDPFPVLQVLG